MLLSELERSGGQSVIHAVEVDQVGARPPSDLQEVGLLARCDETGELAVDVLDTAILYQLHNVHVVLEIPSTVDLPAKQMLILAANMGVDLGLLPPPPDADTAAWSRYSARLKEYALAWLGQRNCQSMVHPVSGYFQYLCGRSLGYTPDAVATDEYIQALYVDSIDDTRMAAIKGELEPVILDAVGGEEGLRAIVHTVGLHAGKQLEAMNAEAIRRQGQASEP